MSDAARWIERLALQAHPEGGFFRETYRSPDTVAGETLPGIRRGPRSLCTAIYYLLRSEDRSRFHRLRSDEIWHHYLGAAATIHLLAPGGGYSAVSLGHDPAGGSEPQILVPAGTWLGVTVDEPDSFTLAGCTVSPGFDFGDFEMGVRDVLCRLYPGQRGIIERLT